ncbi:MAG: AraC family transcriptional regulator [Candidatus Hodarchaeales archaeon]|jgi:DNA gyrase inhibitor GyrI
MENLIIKIVKLESMHVASSHAKSKTPEEDAWAKLTAWAKPKGLFDHPGKHTTFGFNNPPPKDHELPGGQEYGYELLMNIGPEMEPEGDIKTKEIPGGLYAVARVKGVWNIYKTWVYLNEWLATTDYELDEENEPGLEECLTPFVDVNEMIFDLYLPVKDPH